MLINEETTKMLQLVQKGFEEGTNIYMYSNAWVIDAYHIYLYNI